MKIILITGATGFIGQELIKQLSAQECQIRVLVRDFSKAKKLLSKVEFVLGDLQNPASLQKACENVDTIFHLAGYAHALKESNGEALRKHKDVNFVGTKNLCAAAVASNVQRFIYFSTVKAVADSSSCTDETFVQSAETPYGRAKRQAEILLLDTARKFPLHVCILRPTLVYGCGVKGNIAQMIHGIKKGYFPPLPYLSAFRSMVSVRDICRAAILAAAHSQSNGRIYIVSDGQQYTTRQLYNEIRLALGYHVPAWHIPLWVMKFFAYLGDFMGKISGKRFPFDRQAIDKLIGSAQYNSQRIQDELGFVPTENFAMVLPEMIKDRS